MAAPPYDITSTSDNYQEYGSWDVGEATEVALEIVNTGGAPMQARLSSANGAVESTSTVRPGRTYRTRLVVVNSATGEVIFQTLIVEARSENTGQSTTGEARIP